MKKTILLISLICSTQLYGLAPMPLSQMKEVKLHSLITQIREKVDNKKVVTKSKGEFTLRAEIVEKVLYVHLMKKDVLDASAIFSIGGGGATAELGQSDFGNMKRQGIITQLAKYVKDVIPHGTKWEDFVVNPPTIEHFQKTRPRTLKELQRAYLETPLGKLMTIMGFNDFKFLFREKGIDTGEQVFVTDDNISEFMKYVDKYYFFFIEARKIHQIEYQKEVNYEAGVEVMPNLETLKKAIGFTVQDSILQSRAILGAI